MSNRKDNLRPFIVEYKNARIKCWFPRESPIPQVIESLFQVINSEACKDHFPERNPNASPEHWALYRGDGQLITENNLSQLQLGLIELKLAPKQSPKLALDFRDQHGGLHSISLKDKLQIGYSKESPDSQAPASSDYLDLRDYYTLDAGDQKRISREHAIVRLKLGEYYLTCHRPVLYSDRKPPNLQQEEEEKQVTDSREIKLHAGMKLRLGTRITLNVVHEDS
jgi:hypothetical protein